MVLAPVVRGRKGEYKDLLEELRAEGYTRAKIDGELRRLEDDIELDKKYKHDIAVVVDRLQMKPDVRKRLADSVETAVALAEGIVEVELVDGAARDAKPHSTGAKGVRESRRHAGLLGEVLLPEMRHVDAGAGAADLLVQLPARRLPAVHRPRLPDGDRPGPGGGPVAVGQRGRDPALELGGRLLRAARTGDRREVRHRPRRAVGGPARGGPGPLPVRRRGRARVRLLPQPDGAAAVVHGAARGHRDEPRAPLSGDRLRVFARAHRGVHVGAAVPGMPRRAPAARDTGREGRRDRHPRVHAQVRARGDRVARRPRPDGYRAADRLPDPEGDRRAAAVPRLGRRRLPDAGASGGHAVGRRGPAHPPCDADRLQPRGRALHPGRALDRTAPARQPQAARHAGAAARPRQHGDRGRARRGHDAGRRPHRGPRPRRGRARRADRRRGAAGEGEASLAVAHRPVPGRQAADPGAGGAAQAQAVRSRSWAPSSTT